MTNAAVGWPLGVGRGVAPAGGVAPARGFPPGANPPEVHSADDFGERRTLVPVTAPVVASLRPVASTHVPVVTSASVATDVFAKEVLVVYMPVLSPLGPVRMRVWPLICTS